MDSERWRKTRVLISAFACEADEGSEPEVGWSWAHEMSKEVDVIVLTQGKNQERIEKWYAEHPEVTVRPDFIYLDLGQGWLNWKKKLGPVLLPYYLYWQWQARVLVDELVKNDEIDLIHHVTFASFRYPVFLRGRPVVWGPIGGADNAPWRLIFKGSSVYAAGRELVRNLATHASIFWLKKFSKNCEKVGYAFACTPRTQEVILESGIPCETMPTISSPDLKGACPERLPHAGMLELLYVGRLHHLKGVHLLIEALAQANNPQIHLKLAGKGPTKKSLLRMISQLNLTEQVSFLGQIPRSELAGHYRTANVLVAPSLYESGGMTVLEAASQGTPSIVLDCGGHALSVLEGAGIKVDSRQSPAKVVEELSLALSEYFLNPDLAVEHGARAWDHLKNNYSWDQKRAKMLRVYQLLLKKNGNK